MQPKKRALGKGLEALLPRKAAPASPESAPVVAMREKAAPATSPLLSIQNLHPNPAQPRVEFDPGALDELAESIRIHGIIQPLAVVARANDTFMIVAGERRWRAAQLAGLTQIPAVVVEELSDQQLLEWGLVENLQREDLNAIEEAQAYEILISRFNLTQDQVAEHVGKSRSTITNALRLLKLPEDIRRDISSGRLSAGHARTLLSIENVPDRQRLHQEIMNHQYSVREAEDRAAALLNRGKKQQQKLRGGRHQPVKQIKDLDQNMKSLRDQLIDALGVRVDLWAHDEGKGRIEIHYDSLDELQRVLDALGVEA